MEKFWVKTTTSGQRVSTMASSSPSFSSSPFRSNLYAQEMNNSAASCIEIGLYPRALSSLKRALSLSRRQQPPREAQCPCYRCTLDGCIIVSGITAIRRNDESGEGDASEVQQETSHNNETDKFGEFISRKPIRVTCQGHVMGPALYLIIAYNLALTNHLISIHSKNEGEQTQALQKSLELYRRTYEMQANILHHESEKDPPLASPTFAAALRSIRFEMMILNNKSQAHKLAENFPAHNQCLKRLLSTMMIVVDHHVRISTAEGAFPVDPIWQIDMDGFIRNVLLLILGRKYTSVAA